MKRLLLAWLLLSSTLPVQATHRVEVLETYPPGREVVLGPGEKFYLRIGWSTDSMTRIHARPYSDGSEVHAWTSPSPRYDQGSGETAAWFSFTDTDERVDEIRLFVGNSKHRLGTVHAVSVTSGDATVARPPAPAWVSTLERQVVEATGGPQLPPTPSEERGFIVFMLAAAGVALFALVAPVRAFRRWRGGWRIAAAIPMAVMGLFVAFLLLTAALDAGPLNLLPFVVLTVAVPCGLFMAVLLLARWLSGAHRGDAA